MTWAAAEGITHGYTSGEFRPATASLRRDSADAPVAIDLMTVLFLPAVPIGLISLIHWPLWLSPPWYRRWYKRGGRMGNKAPPWDAQAPNRSRQKSA